MNARRESVLGASQACARAGGSGLRRLRTHLIWIAILLGFSVSPAMALPDWDVYLWETPSSETPRAEAAQPLLDALRREIDSIVDADHLAPLRFSGADQVNEGFYLYTAPGRILRTLGCAYPYLDERRKGRVREYVRRELADPRFVPWTQDATLPPDVGTRRESFAMDRMWQWEWARERAASRPRAGPLYGLWLLARHGAVGDSVTNQWNVIRAFYASRKTEDALYGALGDDIAVARLARMMGDADTLRIAVDRARTTFRDGLDLEAMVRRMTRAFARQYDGIHGRGLAAANGFFLELAPEVGRYLHDHLREPVLLRHQALLKDFPHWWVYRPWYASGWTGHESAGLPPEILGMIFPIERWVVKASPETLAGYQPHHAAHGIGDCHAIEAIVCAISAHQPERWVDVR